ASEYRFASVSKTTAIDERLAGPDPSGDAYPDSVAARQTRARSASETPGRLLRALETLPFDTPSSSAIVSSVARSSFPRAMRLLRDFSTIAVTKLFRSPHSRLSLEFSVAFHLPSTYSRHVFLSFRETVSFMRRSKM